MWRIRSGFFSYFSKMNNNCCSLVSHKKIFYYHWATFPLGDFAKSVKQKLNLFRTGTRTSPNITAGYNKLFTLIWIKIFIKVLFEWAVCTKRPKAPRQIAFLRGFLGENVSQFHYRFTLYLVDLLISRWPSSMRDRREFIFVLVNFRIIRGFHLCRARWNFESLWLND